MRPRTVDKDSIRNVIEDARCLHEDFEALENVYDSEFEELVQKFYELIDRLEILEEEEQ